MEGFLSSFVPMFKKYKVESILIISALFLTLISGFIFVQNNQEKDLEIIEEKSDSNRATNIFIDISGAVQKPGVYEFPQQPRLKDVIDKAQGLSSKADKSFFARNFNLARLVKDQEKIYIPFSLEVNAGVFSEDKHTISINSFETREGRVSINSSSAEELEKLPQIGKVTSQKIIDNRPYNSLNELTERKIVSKNAFDKIKDLIEL